jgi:hypothetical protein
LRIGDGEDPIDLGPYDPLDPLKRLLIVNSATPVNLDCRNAVGLLSHQ